MTAGEPGSHTGSIVMALTSSLGTSGEELRFPLLMRAADRAAGGQTNRFKMGVNAVTMVTVLLVSWTPSFATQVGLSEKVLVFPYETDFSFVALIPQKEMALRAFTLCMRVATELPEERQIILFAYRTADYDELNVWREKDGRVSFYLSGDGVFFRLPPLSTFRTSLCLTWESRSGLAAFWADGRRSTYQVYKPGHSVRPKGTVLLGQDPDKHLGGLEATQSFVGEMTDVNMWDFVLSRSMIQAWHYGHKVPKGNIFDWASLEYELSGNVLVVDDD
ncbi:pentraxin fusion protein-like [Poecilia formosa]|uniref:pentraxin fusion protein-like n=1 Tax=Poecilia formosa TaxID=48698 RepID=UPI0007B99343|nr:PREDICTED: pentraxin fusion protein-like [Poecilia formosa]XP_007578069.2 PREDICTED: pentraxin fusion protein-like [Poecilia formosa]